ncbi:MAG: acyl-CoA thioesterase [Propionibacteriaceae bacterium]|nr:acyl-CoA thioesterase [Propionibacteriaceae bacterium]
MKIQPITLRHIVMGQDLNHHGTLYAGRCVEWMVEAGLIAACDATRRNHIVCVHINDLSFRTPVHKGDQVEYTSTLCYAGRSSLVVYVRVESVMTGGFVVDGFFTYVNVTDDGAPLTHGIVVEATTDEETKLMELGSRFATKQRP